MDFKARFVASLLIIIVMTIALVIGNRKHHTNHAHPRHVSTPVEGSPSPASPVVPEGR